MDPDSIAPSVPDLSAAQLERLLLSSTHEQHPSGTVLFREGDLGDAMYVIDRGDVQIFHEDASGARMALRRLGPGQTFGELALIERGGRRLAGARTLTDTRLRRISREAFEALLDEARPLRQRLLGRREDHLLGALRRRSALVRALAQAPVRVRVRELAAGEVLVRKGDPPGPAFVVARGSVVLLDEDVTPPAVVWRTSEGSCVGERSVLEDRPRRGTLVAESGATVLEIEADALRHLVATSPEWRAQLTELRRVYDLPRLGYVTQFTGENAGNETLVTLYHLPDGRRATLTREVGHELFTADVSGAPVADTVAWSGDGCEVELRLSATGALVGAEVRGAWRGSTALARHLLEDRILLPGQLARFERDGELELPLADSPLGPLACACLVVPEARVRRCIADGARSVHEIQAELGCGTVCGGCVPGLHQLFGDDAWTPASLTARTEIAPGIFQLRIEPEARAPAIPGQHIVVRARVGGHPVERSYTLLEADGAVSYDIAVKRESRGLLSRWLTGVTLPAALEVSAPQGHVVLREDMADVVCLVAGIGVTPAVALAREIVGRPLPTRLHVDHTCRNQGEFAFGDELLGLARDHTRISVRLRATAEAGRITAPELAALAGAHRGGWFYLCGPEPFLVHCRRALVDAGVPEDRLLVEVFTPTGGPLASRTPAVSAHGGGAGDYAGWTVDSALFSPPRRLQRQTARLFHNALRANSLLWQSLSRQFASTDTVDRRLPTVPLGAARGFAFGLESLAIDHFGRLATRAPAAPSPDPFQPDGDTFVVLSPTPDLVRGSPVETPWQRAFDEPVMPIHVLRGPTAARSVLDDPERFDRGPLPFHYSQQVLAAAGTPPAGHDSAGLLVGRYHGNARWREDRDVGLQALVPAMLERAAGELPEVLASPLDAIAARVAAWPDAPLDAHRVTSRLALRMVLSVLFGRAALDEVERAAEPVAGLAGGITDFVEDMLARRAGAAEVAEARRRGVAALLGIRAALHSAYGRMPAEERDRPWVRRLLENGEDTASIERVYAGLLPLLVAGHETTGTVMAWALYVLGRDPALSARVVAEIDRWRRERPGVPVGLLAQNHRPETLSLLLELYRRYPPVAQTMRTASVDGEMPADPDTGIGAFRYYAGSVMMVSIVAIHRDPRWWADPDRFDPSRFFQGISPGASDEDRGRFARALARKAEDAGRYIPFLRGPSGCVGRGLNQVELFAFLDALLSRFTVTLADPARTVEARGTTISGPPPGAVAVILRPR